MRAPVLQLLPHEGVEATEGGQIGTHVSSHNWDEIVIEGLVRSDTGSPIGRLSGWRACSRCGALVSPDTWNGSGKEWNESVPENRCEYRQVAAVQES